MILAHPKDKNILYRYQARENPALEISLDSGKTWQTTNIAEYNLKKLYFDYDQGKTVYATFDNKVLRSDDFVQSWQPGSGNEQLINSESGLAVDPRDNTILYLGTKSNGVLFSRDGGRKWQPRNNGLTSSHINTIAVDPNNPDIVYAGAMEGAFISFDQGEHWSQINDGLIGATIVYSIAVDAQSNVYATTPNGVFKLLDR